MEYGAPAVAGNLQMPPGVFLPAAHAATAVAGNLQTPPAVTLFDLNYFRNLPLTADYKAHNVALTWFREVLEDEAELTRMWSSNTEPEEVAEMVVEYENGFAFHFDEDVFTTWKWQEMVAQLDEPPMRVVVNGQNNLSRGLVGCSIKQSKIYDQKRHQALQRLDVPTPAQLFVWDFVLERDDGSCVELHPNYVTTKLSCKVHPRPCWGWRFAGEPVDLTLYVRETPLYSRGTPVVII